MKTPGAARRFATAATCWRGVAGALVAVVALAVVFAEQRLVSTDGAHAAGWAPYRCKLADRLERQAVVTDAIRRHGSPTLVYAFPTGAHLADIAMQVEVMRAAQDLGVASVNGYSGYMAFGWDTFPDYRSLMGWLVERHHFTPARLRGLVLLGDPRPDPDPVFEAGMRAAHPTTPLR